jgi:hypothetical protein
MFDPIDALIHDLFEWVGPRPLPYSEVIGAWRTFALVFPSGGRQRKSVHYPGASTGLGSFVSVTAAGRIYLAQHHQRPEATQAEDLPES